jgi:hypothetical protein
LEYQKALAGCNSVHEKVLGLLYSVHSTQPFPKLDAQMNFLTELWADNSLETMEGFLNRLVSIKPRLIETEVCNVDGNPAYINYRIMFLCLQEQEGWGNKTAALFCKVVFDIHAHFPELRFWIDAPNEISAKDELYLPVDKVITHIMESINEVHLSNFQNINDYLKITWKGVEILIWDDLWFWGFITQKGNDENRTMEFNPAKLWSLQAIQKDSHNIEEIEKLANEFIHIITSS